MATDLSTLAPDTPVMSRAGHIGRASDYYSGKGEIARVGEWLPTDEQEVPREKWATITHGSRVRVEYHEGTVIIGTSGAAVNGRWLDVGTVHCVNLQADVARVWVLDEPDPDADLIERMAQTIADNLACEGVGTVSPLYRELATKALAVVREADAR